jgi:hypothetical protein
VSTKEALLKEIEKIPEPVLDEVLDFAQFLRAKLGGNPVPHPKRPMLRKLSWAKTFAEMAAAREDWSDWDTTLGDTDDT